MFYTFTYTYMVFSSLAIFENSNFGTGRKYSDEIGRGLDTFILLGSPNFSDLSRTYHTTRYSIFSVDLN